MDIYVIQGEFVASCISGFCLNINTEYIRLSCLAFGTIDSFKNVLDLQKNTQYSVVTIVIIHNITVRKKTI